jgi:cbb3-type cytochrome oxidase maturation protein
MNILLVLIPVTLLIVLVAVALFFWAVNHQQFDDLDSPAALPLMDDAVDPDSAPDAAQEAQAPRIPPADAAIPARKTDRSQPDQVRDKR